MGILSKAGRFKLELVRSSQESDLRADLERLKNQMGAINAKISSSNQNERDKQDVTTDTFYGDHAGKFIYLTDSPPSIKIEKMTEEAAPMSMDTLGTEKINDLGPNSAANTRSISPIGTSQEQISGGTPLPVETPTLNSPSSGSGETSFRGDGPNSSLGRDNTANSIEMEIMSLDAEADSKIVVLVFMKQTEPRDPGRPGQLAPRNG